MDLPSIPPLPPRPPPSLLPPLPPTTSPSYDRSASHFADLAAIKVLSIKEALDNLVGEAVAVQQARSPSAWLRTDGTETAGTQSLCGLCPGLLMKRSVHPVDTDAGDDSDLAVPGFESLLKCLGETYVDHGEGLQADDHQTTFNHLLEELRKARDDAKEFQKTARSTTAEWTSKNEEEMVKDRKKALEKFQRLLEGAKRTILAAAKCKSLQLLAQATRDAAERLQKAKDAKGSAERTRDAKPALGRDAPTYKSVALKEKVKSALGHLRSQRVHSSQEMLDKTAEEFLDHFSKVASQWAQSRQELQRQAPKASNLRRLSCVASALGNLSGAVADLHLKTSQELDFWESYEAQFPCEMFLEAGTAELGKRSAAATHLKAAQADVEKLDEEIQFTKSALEARVTLEVKRKEAQKCLSKIAVLSSSLKEAEERHQEADKKRDAAQVGPDRQKCEKIEMKARHVVEKTREKLQSEQGSLLTTTQLLCQLEQTHCPEAWRDVLSLLPKSQEHTLSFQELTDMHAVFTGRRLNDYKVSAFPKFPGEHSVWKAEHDGCQCLLKEIKLSEAPHFSKVIALHVKHRHPNIAPLAVAFMDSDCGYLHFGNAVYALDSVNPLDAKSEPLFKVDSVARLLYLLHGLASALEYLHGRATYHGDVQPCNYLITQDGRPQLTHFHFMREKKTPGHKLPIGGAVSFLAPELKHAAGGLRNAKPISGESDMYALGKTFQFVKDSKGCAHLFSGSGGAELSDKLSGMIDRMCRDLPEDRPTPVEVTVDLHQWWAQEALKAASSGDSCPSCWTTLRTGDGWAAVPVSSIEEAALAKALIPGGTLGGKDQRVPGDHTKLSLKCAWRIENPTLFDKYRSERKDLQNFMKNRAYRKDPNIRQPFQDLAVQRDAPDAGLLQQLDNSVNEVYLAHSTKPEVLVSIFHTGFNERYSGGLFGHGIYSAEDCGKTDQYVRLDTRCGVPGFKLLHDRLYCNGVEHPGNVFYVIFCRVLLGHFVKTKDGNDDSDSGASVWADPEAKRELASIPDCAEKVPFHSLIAETGRKLERYREFIQFHGRRMYPEYLVAYQRQ